MNNQPSHDELREQAALYVLGGLSRADREAFESHVAGCAECRAELGSLAPVAGALARAVPLASPPAALRDRVLNAVGALQTRPDTRATTASANAGVWFVAAASLILAAALGVYSARLRSRIDFLELELREATRLAQMREQQVADTQRAADQARSTVAVLAAPDLARVDLVGQPAAPRASARAFWSRSRGLVFTASDLPALPAGRVYQLWVVTAQAPVSAGLLRPDAEGRVSAVIETPRDLPTPVAMAVTIEPEGGVPAPTGDRYLVGTVSGL